MSDAFPPRPVENAPIRDDINLTGYLFPWQDGNPALVRHDGTDDLFLPLFTTEEKLRQMTSEVGLKMDGIKRIDDGNEFLDSLPDRLPGGQRLRIMLDPYRVPEDNKTRFTEVVRGSETK